MTWLIYAAVLLVAFFIPVMIGFFQPIREDMMFLDPHSHGLACRGAAISMVILCHFMGRFGGGITYFTPLGGIGVSIFLFLSGYGLSVSWKHGGGYCYWRKRIVGVIIPYALFEIVTYWVINAFSIVDFILDVICVLPKYENGWYLQYQVMWYIIFYIVMMIPFFRKHRIKVFVALAIISFFLFREIKAEQALSFVSGVIIAEYYSSERLKKLINLKTSVLLISLGVFALAIKQTSVIRTAPELVMKLVQLCIKLPVGLGLITLIFIIGKRISLKGFEWIGIISFELYLVHGVVGQYIPKSILGELVYIGATISFSMLFFFLNKWIKKHTTSAFRINKAL